MNLPFFAVACAAVPLWSRDGELDALVARTNDLLSFSALYTLKTTKDDPPTAVRIEYLAPNQLRVDKQSPDTTATTWCIDGVLTLHVHGKDEVYGQAGYDEARATLADLERVLDDNFPGAQEPEQHSGPVASMRWWFDEKSKKANFAADAVWVENVREVGGWLATLRTKHGPPTVEGDYLVFDSSDGVFHVKVSRDTGFLEELIGNSPTGSLKLARIQLARNEPIAPSRFVPPSQPEQARDVSSELVRSLTGVAAKGLRARIYSRIAGQAGEPWDEAARAKIERVLLSFNVRAVDDTLVTWRANAAKKLENFAARLREAEGKATADVVAAERAKELGYLTKSLDELREGFATRLIVPETTAAVPRAEELLAIEREILTRVFDENVRAPTLANFERATAPKQD